MLRAVRSVVVGAVCAVPIALVAAWFANAVLDPAITRPEFSRAFVQALGLGPLRGVAFAAGTILAGALLAPRVADERLDGLAGLAAFMGLVPLLAGAGAALELVVRDPAGLDAGVLVGWPVGLLLVALAGLVVWLPAGVLWLSAVRRLLVEDLPATTDLERAQSDALRDAAAREHVEVDATNIADQGSRLYRNRG